jgi:2-polyprenyl-3-methyl-5-hydroxy-6-metoxy-1,4-benzoquinol methylase
MNRYLDGRKRTADMSVAEVQGGNAEWWSTRPMSYDWRDERQEEPGSASWFDRMDRDILDSARLFATRDQPLDQIIPLSQLAGKRVLEIGCGMGFHSETMIRAGAQLTAIDLTQTAVDMTRRRLQLRGLKGEILQADAEQLPFDDRSFDFVWSWGVIHHSARTGRIVRQIARVLRPNGECRVMVYNRQGAAARMNLLVHHYLKGGFLSRSVEETLSASTDGFSARYYTKEQFEDLFRAFFEEVSSEIWGQVADVLPLPRRLREPLSRLVSDSYMRAAQARRGSFLFLQARRPT